MFERSSARIAAAAERRARARASEIAVAMAAERPPGIDLTVVPGGIALSGRGLWRRFALDPAVRWLAAVRPGRLR